MTLISLFFCFVLILNLWNTWYAIRPKYVKDEDVLFIECISIILGGILILPLLISSLHILPWLLAFPVNRQWHCIHIVVCMCTNYGAKRSQTWYNDDDDQVALKHEILVEIKFLNHCFLFLGKHSWSQRP